MVQRVDTIDSIVCNTCCGSALYRFGAPIEFFGYSHTFWNFASVYMLGEKFDFRYDLPGVMLTCAGCITTVAFANTAEQDFTLDSMVGMLLAPKALFYMFGTALSIIASLICITMITTWLFPFEQAFRASIAGEDLRMRLVLMSVVSKRNPRLWQRMY